ncbi:hypothetical protein FQR65_LT01277 [Abscondita terminalis]|nr:hypothetical protein FQR65_LT01277 [Abscondita terminalis]
MEDDPRIKTCVFDGATTYLHDYRKCTPYKRRLYDWTRKRFEIPQKEPKEFRRRDMASFIEYKKGSHVPFNLFIKPRPIIDTNPEDEVPRLVKYTKSKRQKLIVSSFKDKPIDVEKEEVMKSRPRLYMTPAVSMDDVPDPETRRLLCNHMYSTEFRKAAQGAAAKVNDRPIARSIFEVGRDPVKVKVEVNPPLPHGWREKGKDWDHCQLRSLVDPTETFWKNKGPPNICGACPDPFKDAVPLKAKKEIAALIKEDKLRMPHDYLKPGYTGFKPTQPQLIPLSKTDLPVVHPFLTTSQVITQRYKDDSQTKRCNDPEK